MKTTRRAAGLLSGLIAAGTLTLAGATPASAATWTLMHHPGHEQRVCLWPNTSWHGTYLHAPFQGVWTTDIDLSMRNLPPGSYSNGGLMQGPGSSVDGTSAVGFVHVEIVGAPAGEYIAEIVADDGTETQSIPVIITFSENC
ncbi:DUF5980 family protein [Streptomyces marincola]|uniref:DUF5980 family protein n=1 Tax=Streptomyces marincola TaxID=2878388 RepID=UPI001CF33791|nr:DUF5980 family protein [Streptomyces marincola]UCM90580.1 hypothetical protein LC193_23045 [Streptomyces marincola]